MRRPSLLRVHIQNCRINCGRSVSTFLLEEAKNDVMESVKHDIANHMLETVIRKNKIELIRINTAPEGDENYEAELFVFTRKELEELLLLAEQEWNENY